MQLTPSPEVLPLFCKAGWTPARAAPTPPNVDPDHPGATVLGSCLGLKVLPLFAHSGGMDIRFTNSLGYDPGASEWQRHLGTQLVVIAEVDEERGVLFISADGRYFVLDYGGGFCFAGPDFAAAMDVLLLGRRLKPLLRPTERSTRAYGDEIPRGDPRAYDYKAAADFSPNSA